MAKAASRRRDGCELQTVFTDPGAAWDTRASTAAPRLLRTPESHYGAGFNVQIETKEMWIDKKASRLEGAGMGRGERERARMNESVACPLPSDRSAGLSACDDQCR